MLSANNVNIYGLAESAKIADMCNSHQVVMAIDIITLFDAILIDE